MGIRGPGSIPPGRCRASRRCLGRRAKSNHRVRPGAVRSQLELLGRPVRPPQIYGTVNNSAAEVRSVAAACSPKCTTPRPGISTRSDPEKVPPDAVGGGSGGVGRFRPMTPTALLVVYVLLVRDEIQGRRCSSRIRRTVAAASRWPKLGHRVRTRLGRLKKRRRWSGEFPFLALIPGLSFERCGQFLNPVVGYTFGIKVDVTGCHFQGLATDPRRGRCRPVADCVGTAAKDEAGFLRRRRND